MTLNMNRNKKRSLKNKNTKDSKTKNFNHSNNKKGIIKMIAISLNNNPMTNNMFSNRNINPIRDRDNKTIKINMRTKEINNIIETIE
jgi:hypothetical protein